MAKAYWINFIQSVQDPERMAEYAALAGPAIEGHGGRFLARGRPTRVFEGGRDQRTVVIEFDSLEAAVACYESPEYQRALEALGDGAERDLRIIEGLS